MLATIPHRPISQREAEYLTQKQLEHRLEVTPMTIFLWRKGQGVSEPLPCNTVMREKKSKNSFSVNDVIAWLERNRPGLVDKFKEDGCVCQYCKKRRVLCSSTQGCSTLTEVLQY